jgi:hypothetical protein
VGRQYWDHWDKFGMRPVLQALRSQAGEQMVADGSARQLLHREGFAWRHPAEPTRRWRSTDGRSLSRARGAVRPDVATGNPHRGRPSRRDSDRGRLRGVAQGKQRAQTVPEGRARRNTRRWQGSRTCPKPARANRSHDQGRPFCPGRLTRRNRKGHRQLDGEVGLTGGSGARKPPDFMSTPPLAHSRPAAQHAAARATWQCRQQCAAARPWS